MASEDNRQETFPFRTAKTLAQRYCDELEQFAGLTSGSIQIYSSKWLKGKQLVVAADRSSIDKLQKAWKTRKAETSIIRGMSLRDGATYFCVALESWHRNRGDLKIGCPSFSLENNEAVDSPNNEQAVKVIARQVQLLTTMPKSQELPGFWEQKVVHWLRTSCRLNAADVSVIMDFLESTDYRALGDENYVSNRFKKYGHVTLGTRRMLEFAIRALVEALSQLIYIDWLALYSQPSMLARARLWEPSRADSLATHKYAVAVFFDCKEPLYQNYGPSFIMARSSEVSPKDQVHVIGRYICRKQGGLIVVFDDCPARERIRLVVHQLRETLRIPAKVRALNTQPFCKDPGEIWFRADGWLDYSFVRTLRKHVKNVLPLSQRTQHGSGNWEAIASHWVFQPGRNAVRLWFFVRQSNEESTRAHDSIPDQMETLLRTVYDMGMLQVADRVLVSIETCSSSRHPWSDRPVLNNVPKDLPLILVTVNPDRVTRRFAEVQLMLDLLESTGGAWFTQGFPEKPEEGPATWRHVTRDTMAELEQRLKVGRQRALAASYSVNANNAAIRINNCLDRGAAPRQLEAIRQALHLLVKKHGFDKILIVSQSCATTVKAEDIKASNSVDSQTKFLRSMLPDGIPFALHEETDKSAWSGDLLKILLQRITDLSKDGSKILILSTRLDRIARRKDVYQSLCEFLKAGGHGAASYFWDQETDIGVCCALRLDAQYQDDPIVQKLEESMELAMRAPAASTNCAVPQLLLWAAPGGIAQDDPTIVTADRHLANAQDCIEAGFSSRYQGVSKCAEDLKVKRIHRFTVEEQNKWINRILRGHDIDGNEVILRNKPEIRFANAWGKSYICSCEARWKEDRRQHEFDCQCRCRWCDKARACPCADIPAIKDKPQLCACPYFCNCTCACCHKRQSGTAGTGQVTGKRKRVGEGTCEEDGCKAPIDRTGLCSKHYQAYRKNKPCVLCGARMAKKDIHGEACHDCRIKDVTFSRQLCQWPRFNCKKIRYSGGCYHALCEEHGAQDKKEKAKATRERKKAQKIIDGGRGQ